MKNHHYTKLSFAALGLALMAGCGGGGGGGDVTPLESGTAVTGSVGAGEMKYYSIDVPNLYTGLNVVLEATSGEVDCLLNPGEKPTAQMYESNTVYDSDYAIAGTFDAYCMGGFETGTWYVAAWGNTVDSETSNPGGNYTMTATLTDYSSYFKTGVSQQELDQALRTVAKRYVRHLRGKTVAAAADTYPESGIVDIQKGDDHYRFYFGSDAVTPAVLSVDHNGAWTHFYSWQEFEAVLAGATD